MTSTSSTSSTDRWTNAFIPETSKSWEGKPMCKDEFDPNQNCCASGYDIEAIVDQAYDDGLGEHPGVLAIQSKPCVSSAHLESLADQLATMAFEDTSDEGSKNIVGPPKTFSPLNNPKEINDPSILDYCADLVHRVTTKSYGGSAEIPERESLGEKFKDTFSFCAEAIVERISIIDIFNNSYMHKKKQIRVPIAYGNTYGLEDQDGPKEPDWF